MCVGLRFLVLTVALLCVNSKKPYSIEGASQVHLSLGEEAKEVVVTWSTPKPAQSTLRYGLSSSFPSNAVEVQGFEKRFVDNGTLHHTQFIHRVHLRNLQELSEYSYQVINNSEWSRTYSFVSPGDSNWFPKATIYGDFGLLNPRAFPALVADLSSRATDFIVHSGDFAYDLYQDNATFGDAWFDFVEPVYASQPVMTCVGNHEGIYDYLNYRSRFSMPMYRDTENLFFSFNAGNTHWISYSTEFYYVYEAMDGHGGVHRNFGPYPELQKAQLRFVEEDLIKANKERSTRPWIFAFGHRPMYCSDSDDDDCTKMLDSWKTDLENLFYKYGVDIIFEAHQHTYERLWPTYQGKVYNSSTPGQPYNNPLAPIHIVAGAAGCDELLDRFDDGALGDWSAVRIADYGIGHLTILNNTHLKWEQLDIQRKVVDEILVQRDKHLPYPFLN